PPLGECNRSRGKGDKRAARVQGRALAQASRDIGIGISYGPGELISGPPSWPQCGLLFVVGTEATTRRDSLNDSADGPVTAGFEREHKGVSCETNWTDHSE